MFDNLEHFSTAHMVGSKTGSRILRMPPGICLKYAYVYRTKKVAASRPSLDLRRSILGRIKRDKSIQVWTPNDFLDLGPRSAIDKALQRLVLAGSVRRIDRGLYDVPRANSLTGKPSSPDYTAIIDAVARREKARLLPMESRRPTNWALPTQYRQKLRFTQTPGCARFTSIDSSSTSNPTAPSRLYWAGRPAMRLRIESPSAGSIHMLQAGPGDSIMDAWFPFPGCDVAGVVERVGAGVTEAAGLHRG